MYSKNPRHKVIIGAPIEIKVTLALLFIWVLASGVSKIWDIV